MNEITRIHLGRQPFTISVDAHKELKAYLEAIKKRVGTSNKEVIEEIELRMAELLMERGIKDNKVIILDDIVHLKEQLGEPREFSENPDDADETEDIDTTEPAPKRLFRDVQNATWGGVAAGMAAYFGVSVLWMRIIFVILTLAFAGFGGVIIYILLWVLVPPARTPSERLQMRGKPVTVESLKALVNEEDAKKVAHRTADMMQPIFVVAGKILLGVFGGVLIFGSIVTFLFTTFSGTYLLVHGGQVADKILLPIGAKEVLAIICVIIVSSILSFMVFALGLATFNRKRIVKGWVMAALSGILLVTAVVGTVLAIDVAPRIQDRYKTLERKDSFTTQPFKSVQLNGSATDFAYAYDTNYSVEVKYLGSEKKLPIKWNVDQGTLTVDSSGYEQQTSCNFFCLRNDDKLYVTIHAPSIDQLDIKGDNTYFKNRDAFRQEALKLHVAPESIVHLYGFGISDFDVKASDNGYLDVSLARMQNIRSMDLKPLEIFGGNVHIDHADHVQATFPGKGCEENEELLFMERTPDDMKINGKSVEPEYFMGEVSMKGMRSEVNCIYLQQKPNLQVNVPNYN